MKNAIKVVISVFLFLLGFLVLVMEILALIDPVGAKMADDGDPFGNPYQPWYVHALTFAFSIGCFFIGCLLAKSSNKKELVLK
jgi:amino acid permease